MRPHSRALRLRPALAILAGLLAATATARGDDRKPQVPDLKVEKYTLPNGLEVILHEDPTTPVVGVNIWYKVGSKNEKLGRTGFAHLFEHLMFQGSQHHDSEYFGPIEKVGAQINGSTNTDRTNYFETLPSNALELALWLESDRMGFLLPALTQAKLDNQRDVVKNERRQRVDNVPYGQAAEKLDEALYPPEHPYHHSVIGSMADLSAASLADVSAFFRSYYCPNNASLVIAGDIDVAKTKQLVEKYFGPIPRGADVPALKPEVPTLSSSKHITMTDKVTLPRTQLVWPTVARSSDDEQALTVLAEILGGGGGFGGGGGRRGGGGGGGSKQSRLFRALMYPSQIAASASAFGRSSALAGTFDVILSARPDGASLDELIKTADREIEKLKAEGPTEDEVQKIKNAHESRLVMSLEATGRKADFLNNNNVERGDPLAYKKEIADLFAVTPADVKRVANKYLGANRIRIDVNPGPPATRAPEVAVNLRTQTVPPIAATATATGGIADSFDRSAQPKVGPAPKFAPKPVVRRKLSNGLEVLIAERHELPIQSIELVFKGGETLVPAEKHGLASMTASLLTEGTTSRDALKLSDELAEIGASLSARGGLESSSVTVTTLTKHTAKALELFTDVLKNPTFPEREMRRLKTQRLNAIRARGDRAEGVSGTVFPRLLYGQDHPYGRPDLGTAKNVNAITRDDVVDFHKKLYLPNNASLIVVGDTTPDAVTETLEKALQDWKPSAALAKAVLPAPPTSDKGVTVYLVDKPKAAQSVLAVGQVGVARNTPDYFPLVVMNGVLGGQFSSRINLNLREDKGYTYGARSSFAFEQGPGPFEAGGAVQTDVTKEALVELMKELTEITGSRPVTDSELAFAEDRIVRGFPNRFETTQGVAGTLTELVLYDLPDDYFTTYPEKVEAVTKDDVTRVAKTYLEPNKMTILVVGDRAKVEGPLKTLPYAKVINVLDPEGNPLPATTEGGGK